MQKMKPTVIRIPSRLESRLENEAKRQCCSKAGIIRKALFLYLDEREQRLKE